MLARRTRASRTKETGLGASAPVSGKSNGTESSETKNDVTKADACKISSIPRPCRTSTPQNEGCVSDVEMERKRSPRFGQTERGNKRLKKSHGDEDQAQIKGISGPHDSGYLSEHSTASIASGTSGVSRNFDCELALSDVVTLSEDAPDDSDPEYDPLIWNCCRGPSRDKVSQVAGDLFLSIGWCHPEMVMQYIDERERKYKDLRNPRMLERHEDLEPYMRAILLDWMIEVCEAHNLQRETYHLAVDYLDRFLSGTTNIRKNQLQLSGATALFLAAKLEEVQPPRAKEFAYVTDGACTPDEILMHEKTMMQVLKFKMYPLTANMWLEMFLQIATKRTGRLIKELPIVPNVLPSEIVELCRLLEFALMDIRCHKFSYRYLAAATLYLAKDEAMALRVSGLPYEELKACIEFMKPFYEVAQKSAPAECRFVEDYPRKTAFLLQNKNTSYGMVDLVWKSVAAAENRNYGYKQDKQRTGRR